MKKTFCLTQDDDCHWYVIPSDKIDEWNNWIGSEDYENGIVPEYAKSVDGASNVHFMNYTTD